MALIIGIAIVHTTGMPMDYSFDLGNVVYFCEMSEGDINQRLSDVSKIISKMLDYFAQK